MKLKQLFILPLFFIPLVVFAQGSNVGNGGGDGESTFRYYRDVLQQWIELGVIDVTREKNGIVLDWEAIALTMKTANVQFTDKILTVEEGTPRACKNYPDRLEIECNKEEWKAVADNEKLALVFHEYLGLLKYESNIGKISTYPFSSQLIGKLNHKSDPLDTAGRNHLEFIHDPQAVPLDILKFAKSKLTRKSVFSTKSDGTLLLSENEKLKPSSGGYQWFWTPRPPTEMKGGYLKNGNYYLEVGGYGKLKGMIGAFEFEIDQKRCPSYQVGIVWNEMTGIVSIETESTCHSIYLHQLKPVKKVELKSDGSTEIRYDSEPIQQTPKSCYKITVNGKQYQDSYPRRFF